MNPLEIESRKIISQYSSVPQNVDWTNVENNTTIFSLIHGLVQQAETQQISGPEKKNLVLAELEKFKAAENSLFPVKQAIELLKDKLSCLIDSIALSYQGKVILKVSENNK